ncbi:uncharacterized protein IWZ02DRAFT_384893 [Phyllosticta citriasiana]|uniref:Capsule polysaccharide biosynthesis protein n=1 Tax=Phyllosticta citriasiana TaxID=595635 RepID=A0ABR1L0G9_9PEZI
MAILVAGATSFGAFIVSMASFSEFRVLLARLLGIDSPGGIWRLVALVSVFLNLKTLPFVWHIRLFRALVYHLYWQPTPLPPRALFQPLITSTRTPITECDYNLHKSNSTYFSDLDISRSHFVSALLRSGIRRLSSKKTPQDSAPGTEHVKGAFSIALGGITCHFKREVKPYARFEIWTRLLAWDHKWLYLVSHMVRPGVAKPSSFTLQPWKKPGAQGRRLEALSQEEQDQMREKLKGAIYATSIAKYVVKKGRWTVAPELVLRNSGLLPEKKDDPAASDHELKTAEEKQDADNVLEDSALPADANANAGEWAWEHVEAERQRGLKLAEHFAALDGLHDEFALKVDDALGEFSDMVTPFW